MLCRSRLCARLVAPLFLAASSWTSPAAAATWLVETPGELISGGIDCIPATTFCFTLRGAINAAAPGDTIMLLPAVAGQTIELTVFTNDPGCLTSDATQCLDNAQILATEFGPTSFFINKSLTIDGTSVGSAGVTVARSNAGGTPAFRLFQRNDVVTLSAPSTRPR